jgi:hypothetical protein
MAKTRINRDPTTTVILDSVTTNGTTILVAGTYIPPVSCVRLRVRMVGGGGAGASATFSTNANGGAAGAYYEFVITTPASSYTYSVGSGGSSGGVAGGNTVFGTNIAGGGAGGPGGLASAVGGSCSGSLGTSVIQIKGGNGGIADTSSGGTGGISVFSGGGAANGGSSGISAPINSGAGGSASSGLGGSGVIIIEEFYS